MLLFHLVAPDHPEVKNCINQFTKTAEHPNFRFLGNLTLGKDVSLKQLRERYDVVLLTYGADRDSRLNIPNEDKPNSISAREFVGWYNGLPHLKNLNPDLTGETAVLLGQGNVAVDVARVLLSSVDELRKTDITEHALEALARSRIKKVFMVGRRGPLQAAFTIKELREMLKMPNVDTVWRAGDFDGVTAEQIEALARPRKRITELMMKSLGENKSGGNRQFLPVFFRSPQQINGNTKVESIDLTVTQLVDNRAVATAETERIPADLVLRSIGYKSICADEDINFDHKRGLINNHNGRVLQPHSNDPDPGLYVAGWLATGPTGVILTTMNNSFAVAQTIVHDIQTGALKCESNKPGIDPNDFKCAIAWRDWVKIDRHEVEMGKKANKPREKILNVDEMLRVATQ